MPSNVPFDYDDTEAEWDDLPDSEKMARVRLHLEPTKWRGSIHGHAHAHGNNHHVLPKVCGPACATGRVPHYHYADTGVIEHHLP